MATILWPIGGHNKQVSDILHTYCSSPSSHSLIVPHFLISERDVIHASLGGGAHLEGTKHHVSNTLASEHVTTHNSSSVRGVQN